MLFITADREYICRNIDWDAKNVRWKGYSKKLLLTNADLTKECKAGRSIGYFESFNFLEALESIEPSETGDINKEQIKAFSTFLMNSSRLQDNTM